MRLVWEMHKRICAKQPTHLCIYTIPWYFPRYESCSIYVDTNSYRNIMGLYMYFCEINKYYVVWGLDSCKIFYIAHNKTRYCYHILSYIAGYIRHFFVWDVVQILLSHLFMWCKNYDLLSCSPYNEIKTENNQIFVENIRDLIIVIWILFQGSFTFQYMGHRSFFS